MNAKTAKLFRKYAKEQTKTKETAKLYYRKLKAEYKEYQDERR